MTYPFVNRLFTLACFAMPPVLGSVVSFVWHGGAIWCLMEIARGKQRLSDDAVMKAMTLFLYLYVAASILSFFMNEPSWQSAHKLVPLATFLFFPFSYSLWAISDKRAIMRAAIFASMAASYGALALALLQHYGIGLRAEGAAGNALVFANVTCMAALTSLAGALLLEKRWTLVLLLAYAAGLLAVLYSESRSVWIVLVVLTAMVLFIGRRRVGTLLRGHKLEVIGIVLVVGILSSGLVLDRMELLVSNWERLTSHGDYKTSLGYRLALWQVALDLFAQSPIVGHGMQNTGALIEGKLLSTFGLRSTFTHFHNGFLTILVEDGLLGFGAVVGLFATAAVTAWRGLRRAADETGRFGAVLLLILLVSYAVGGSVNIVFGHDILDTMFMIFLITGAYLAAGTSLMRQTP